MSEKKFLIIGYGNMGKLHCDTLVSILGKCTFEVIDKKNLKFKNNNYKQIKQEDIVDINSYDGIIISTHSDSHISYLKKLNEFNKTIFIEKPIVNNLNDLNKLKSLNKKNIFCGFIETQNDLFKIAKENLNEEPFFIQVERISPKVKSDRIKDNVDFDLTIHDISVALEFFIDYKNIVSSKSTNMLKNKDGLYELNNFNIETKECILNFSSSRLGQKKIRNWKIFTIKEQVNIDLIKKEIVITRKNKNIELKKDQLIQNFNEKIINDPGINPAKNQMLEYLKCLDDNQDEYKYNNLIYSHELLLS